MIKTKLIFDSLALHITKNNLKDKIHKILQANVETSICIIYNIDSSYSMVKEIFKYYTEDSLHDLLQSYLDDNFIFKKNSHKKNPYQIYNDKIPLIYNELYNLLEITFKNINEEINDDNRKISYLLIPYIKTN